jgi:peptidoglycan/LPS O-acetylase OafA/YrhL
MLVVRPSLSLAGDALAQATAWLSLKRIGDLDRGRANNLNLLRFVAATLVVLSHSWPLAGAGLHDPLAQLQRHFDLGGLAVAAFFAISGYLIARSLDRARGLREFAVARALRVVPAYVVAVLYAALLIGPLCTTLRAVDYLAARGTWDYVATTLTFFGLVDRLPGVFAGNPYPHAVNGSLWTLAIEIFCYAALALVATCGALRRPWLAAAFALALFALGETSRAFVEALPRDEAFTTPRLAGTFVAGALFYAWRDRIALSPVVAAALLAALPLVAASRYAPYGLFGAVAYATLTIAYHPWLDVAMFRRFGDASYGLYVYAFPTQQAIAAATGPIPPLVLFALAFPVVVLLAAASWAWIERPALRWRR